MVCNFANENKEVPMLFRSLESFHRVNATVSKLMISTVDSEFTSMCIEKENETLVFMFDVCHDKKRLKKCVFLFVMDQSLVSAVNCVVQIREADTRDPS